MSTTFEKAAESLRKAYRAGAIAPLRDVLGPTDALGAYAVQDANTRYWVDKGRRIVGRKIGLTSEAVQKQLGVDRPDYGVLFHDMWIPDKGQLNSSVTLQPKVEAEIALVLGRDIKGVQTSPEDILDATESVFAAIEIVDSRIADWKITFADTVADNGSSAFFVLGSDAKSPKGLDFQNCKMALQVNGKVASVGSGAACLGSPLNAASWLARTLVQLDVCLKAGDILLTGALGPMVALKPGDVVQAEIEGLGEVSFTYGDDRNAPTH